MTYREYHHKVQYYETDKMGIVHHSNYIRWMEEARVDLLEQIGWGLDQIEKLGIVSPVVSVECRHVYPAVFPEDITISAAVESFNGVRLKMKYKMENPEGRLVCTGTSEHCFTFSDGRIVRIDKSYPEMFAAMKAEK